MQYIYFSIIFFSLIISFLYIYIICEKLAEAYKKRRVKGYSRELFPYLEDIIKKLINGEEVTTLQIENLKQFCRNKNKRMIIEERLVYYLENFKGDFTPEIIRLCEYTGVVDYEMKKLGDKNLFRKTLAAKRLGEYRSKRAAVQLLKELKVNNNDLKYNVLLALARIGDEESFIKAFENINSLIILSERSLIEIVDSYEGDKTKIYKYMINLNNNFIATVFIKSAGNHRELSLSQDISKFLFDKDKEMRIAAVKAMGNIGDVKYLDCILELLKDSEWEVRAVAAKGLGNFKEEKILMPLVSALSDSQWYVRYNAAASILNNAEGVSVISDIFKGEDKFAKDIIVAAIENSINNNYLLYGTPENPHNKELAMQIKEYIEMKNQAIKL